MKNRKGHFTSVVKISTIVLAVILINIQSVFGQACPTSGTISVDKTCTSAVSLSGDMTINSGKTYTVSSLNLNGHKLIIAGTLIVTADGTGTMPFNVPNGSDFQMTGTSLLIVGPVGNSASNTVMKWFPTSQVTTSTNSTIIMNGSFLNQNNSNVLLNGTMLVNGNFTQNGSPDIATGGSAVIQATGTFSGGKINGTNVSTIIGS
jgi:hypothetical protein